MFSWTLEPVIELLQCVASGKSAKDTAGILSRKYGHISRNACISKAKREGVIFHGDFREHARGEARLKKSPKPRVVGARRPKSTPRPPTPPQSLSQADDEIPIEQRKGLLGLNNHTCRWPCNNPDSPEFYFCGALEADLLEGRPYCARHSKIAYRREQRPRDLSDMERFRRRHHWIVNVSGHVAA